MNNFQDQLDAFKQIVIKNCQNRDFIFKEFFIADHLMITERIAMELCDIYKEADRDTVFALAWLHDYGKPIDIKNEKAITREDGVRAMRKVGLPEAFINKVLECWEKMEMKNEIDLSKECIEVKIVSSADGAAHFVGKFFATYFGDSAQESLAGTVARIKKKIKQDWELKIVLPEVKVAFENRYLMALEVVGEYPKKFLSL